MQQSKEEGVSFKKKNIKNQPLTNMQTQIQLQLIFISATLAA